MANVRASTPHTAQETLSGLISDSQCTLRDVTGKPAGASRQRLLFVRLQNVTVKSSFEVVDIWHTPPSKDADTFHEEQLMLLLLAIGTRVLSLTLESAMPRERSNIISLCPNTGTSACLNIGLVQTWIRSIGAR